MRSLSLLVLRLSILAEGGDKIAAVSVFTGSPRGALLPCYHS